MIDLCSYFRMLSGKKKPPVFQQTSKDDPLRWKREEWMQLKDGTWVRKKDYYSKS